MPHRPHASASALNLDTVLQLYTDAESPNTLLRLAACHLHADRIAIAHALATHDYRAVRQHLHRAKGAVAFLARGNAVSEAFEALADALRHPAPDVIAPLAAQVEHCLMQLETALHHQLDERHT